MFGKLFGRGKPKHDQLGLETSSTVLGIPAADADTGASPVAAVSSRPAAQTPAGWSSAPAVPGMQDLATVLATVKAAQEQAGGDRQALAEMLRAQFSGEAVVVGQESTFEWPTTQQQDPIALLATLTELHEKGVVTDEQFEAQKRRLLG